MQRDICIHSSMLIVSWIRNFVHMHQHKLMYALFLCLSHSVWKQRTFLSISDTDFLSNVLLCQSDQNDWYKFGVFCLLFFSWKRHDPAGNLGKHTNEWLWNDLLGTVEMSVNWASDNVSSVLTNISVWKLNFKTPSGECLCLMTFWKLCWGQRCFPVTLDVSVQILPSGSCKLENSFLHGLILSTTEVGFFIWMTQMF